MVLFTTEADFRKWVEDNLDRIGIKKIILSQEACPDYVVEMADGRILRLEAELFAVNFQYHRHDPSKVDGILACYSKTEEIDGVPVIAINRLHVWDPAPVALLPIDTPLTDVQFRLLATIESHGGLALAALPNYSFRGPHQLWRRFPPDGIAKLPRGKDDSIFSLMRPEAKQFVRKYHHALFGVELSLEVIEALDALKRCGLVSYRPLVFIAALMDGALIEHPAWVPVELLATSEARALYRDRIREFEMDLL